MICHSYSGINGHCYYDREKYEASLPRPAYGPRFLARLYGPVGRFCHTGAALKIDGWLRRLDEKGEAMQTLSPTSHKTTPKGVFISGIARGLRHIQRRCATPFPALAAGVVLVAGVSSLLGAGLVAAAVAAVVALPVSTALGALCLMGVLGVPRAAAEGFRALCNIPIGYARRKEYFDGVKEEEDRAADLEKQGLGPLCKALYDDEREAGKATPAARADWIYGLARHFPEEFLEAAKKTEQRDPAPAAPLRSVIELKNLPN